MLENKLMPSAQNKPIRVTMPASVAFDLDKFQGSVANILSDLGCPECCSGYDITFQLEKEFVINERLEVNSLKRGFALNSENNLGNGVTATLHPQVSNNLENVIGAIARVADRLGHPACCSGFDITFRQELNFIMDQDSNIMSAG